MFRKGHTTTRNFLLSLVGWLALFPILVSHLAVLMLQERAVLAALAATTVGGLASSPGVVLEQGPLNWKRMGAWQLAVTANFVAIYLYFVAG